MAIAMMVDNPRNQTILLLLAIIPFWTSFLIRVLAWRPMLGLGRYRLPFEPSLEDREPQFYARPRSRPCRRRTTRSHPPCRDA